MSVPVSSARVLRFDSFELDLHAGELRKRGVRLRLQGQPIQLLGILLRDAGNLVTRETLRSQLWPANTFVDFDHSLHNAIARIREALGDSADAPRYIETLPRRGYRFIGHIEARPPEEVRPSPETSPNTSSKTVEPTAVAQPALPAPTKKSHAALVIALSAALAIALATPLAWRHFSAVNAAPTIRSIAVLPLQNLSGDPAQEYFADGMTDELITELSRIHSLKVISHTSVMEYKRTQKHLPQIARELGVDGILEGSVIRDGERVRITVQLLDGPNDRHLWSEDYQHEMRDILGLQREIADAITQQIRLQVVPQPQLQLSAKKTVKPEAFEAYLKGRSFITSDFLTVQSLTTAQNYFEESIKKDPDFGLGYVGLAECYFYLAEFNQMPLRLAHEQAQELLNKGMALDDSSGEAHATLALLKWHYDWDWAAADREFDNAIALTPNFGCAHLNHAYFLSWMGRRDEALSELDKTRELDPGYNFSATDAAIYYQSREYGRLMDAARKEIAANPSEWLGHYFLGVGYEASEKRSDAISEYQKAVAIADGDQDAAAALAHAYAVAGKKIEAEKILRDLAQKSKTNYVSPYMIATIYAGLGDKGKSFEFLEKAAAERNVDLSWEIKADLRIDNLRSDPRFAALLQEMSLPQ